MSPGNDEGPSDCSARAFREQVQARNLDSASADAADRKEFERLRAQLAFRRHCVCRTDPADGPVRFIVTCGAWLKEVADLTALRAFVEKIGGAA